jgi:Flp pilus assembly protein TadB
MGYIFFICGTIFLIAMIVISWKSVDREITELPESIAKRNAKRAERKARKEAKAEERRVLSENELEREDYED